MFSRPQTAPLRFIATRLNLPEIEQLARQPGVTDAFRLTIQYHDARHPDQVATLLKTQQSQTATLTVHYRQRDDKPLTLTHAIPPARTEPLQGALRKIGFDRLDDAPDVPYYGADLWLLERAAASFHHDIVLAPRLANGSHAELVSLVSEALWEAVRAIEST